MIQATQIRKGMIIVHEGDPCRVLDFRHVTPGNWRAMVQTKLRNLRTGVSFEHRFRSTDTVERAVLDEREFIYLYQEGEMYHFMDVETFEQISMDQEALGDAVLYLLPEMHIRVQYYQGAPIGIELPPTVDLKVVETEPGLKGATVSAVNKPARLETGLVVQVPPFVEVGDVVRINTSDGTYLERAK
ncbi:MAG TPA: elongation factor P [Blastocatellia bacterium]|nr:elongation factor P [Blastocatellia bacterium]